MTLADHIRPLLRDHDCVIIPDFGGLVADAAPARLQSGRQVFTPPTKLVAFNQALTRNDGLLVDALAQHRGLSIAQAREAVRLAVAELQRDLQETNRTELPGIGIFRRAAGRGLSFEYTGSDNLLPAAYGLPEVVARPVQITNTRLARERQPQPVLRSSPRRGRLARVLPGAALALVMGLLLSAVALQSGLLPPQWSAGLAGLSLRKPELPVAAPVYAPAEPQQATLAQHSWNDEGEAENVSAPAELPAEVSGELGAATGYEEEAIALMDTAVVAAPVAATSASVASAPAVVKAVPAPVPAAKPEAPVAAPKAALKVAPATPTTIKTRTGRYYVIAGAFSSLSGAEKVRKAYKGSTARVILPPRGSRLYRLSVADFADQASAEKEARRLRTKARSTNSHLVLNY